MAGTVTLLESAGAGILKVRWEWESTAGGAADKATVHGYFGEVLALVTIPDAVAAPTALYDVTVEDSEGYDVLQGAGADRSAAAQETAVPTAKSVAFGPLTLKVTNAGATKKGVAILYVQGRRLPDGDL